MQAAYLLASLAGVLALGILSLGAFCGGVDLAREPQVSVKLQSVYAFGAAAILLLLALLVADSLWRDAF